MRDTGLADRIRKKGVRVIEVAGWQTRGFDGGGNPTFRPVGAIHHHTAGSATGTAPSLNICVNGRSDVPGPLCQVLQSREANPADDIAYVIAAGKANHGGVGTWSAGGLTMDSNYESEGLEVEHTGAAGLVVPAARLVTSAKILAAMLEAPGAFHNGAMCCEHFEYARPLGRKVDFRELAPYDPASFRFLVHSWIGRTASAPPPSSVWKDDEMYILDCPGLDGTPFLISAEGGAQPNFDENTIDRWARQGDVAQRVPVRSCAVVATGQEIVARANATRDLLGQIGMLVTDLQGIEQREEIRDIAGVGPKLTILGPATASKDTVYGNLPAEAAGVFTDSMFLELWQAAEDNGIDPVGMVAQSGKETGWGTYPGRVKWWFYNTAGIKVRYVDEVMAILGTGDVDHPLVHQQFPNWQTGAIAHAQHLLAYVGRLPTGLLVDPRYWLVGGPHAVTWAELGGRWAPSPTYGAEIEEIMGRLVTGA